MKNDVVRGTSESLAKNATKDARKKFNEEENEIGGRFNEYANV